MVPRPESRTFPGGSPPPGEACDPVRFAVHLALAIYLSPVFLIVGLIGCTSMMVGGMAQAIRHGGPLPVGRAVVGPKLAGRGQGKAVTRVAGLDREPDVTH
jgi:hypothetical protein